MVLLQEAELLPHGFNLTLDVHPGHVGVIYDFPQPADVGLHRLADCLLIVEPGGRQGHKLYYRQNQLLFTLCLGV